MHDLENEKCIWFRVLRNISEMHRLGHPRMKRLNPERGLGWVPQILVGNLY
jgi:hypothetical protein